MATRTTLAEPSLALLLDNAREAIIAGRAAGIEPVALLLSSADYAQVTRTKQREARVGLPPVVLGIEIRPDSAIREGSVRIVLP
ncbi:hypothetical protein [Pseudonocardia xishanensis]|uniref:Uncharacterized protein n=1 Tax=Pseudonocardia xishanensis TaxID=630995 RepID=A0ABP8RTK7_9PSEU